MMSSVLFYNFLVRMSMLFVLFGGFLFAGKTDKKKEQSFHFFSYPHPSHLAVGRLTPHASLFLQDRDIVENKEPFLQEKIPQFNDSNVSFVFTFSEKNLESASAYLNLHCKQMECFLQNVLGNLTYTKDNEEDLSRFVFTGQLTPSSSVTIEMTHNSDNEDKDLSLFEVRISSDSEMDATLFRNIVLGRYFNNYGVYKNNTVAFGINASERIHSDQIEPLTHLDTLTVSEVRRYIKIAKTYLCKNAHLDKHGNYLLPLAKRILNGGLGTRMNSSQPKGLIEVLSHWGGQDLSMIEMHLLQIRELERELEREFGEKRYKFPVYICTSFQTDIETITILKKKELLDEYIHVYAQGLSSRRFVESSRLLEKLYMNKNPHALPPEKDQYIKNYESFMEKHDKTYGDNLPEDVFGKLTFAPTGHFDSMVAALISGGMKDMKEHGVVYTETVNVHHMNAHRSTFILLGQLLDIRSSEEENKTEEKKKTKTVVQVVHVDKKTGGLYKFKKHDVLIIDNSLLDFYTEEAREMGGDYLDEAKEYQDKKKIAMSSGYYSTAHYVYKNGEETVKKYKKVPSFKDHKLINTKESGEVFVVQEERQIQSYIFGPETHGKALLLPECATSEIKESKDIAKEFSKFILDSLGALRHSNLSKDFCKKSFPEVMEKIETFLLSQNSDSAFVEDILTQIEGQFEYEFYFFLVYLLAFPNVKKTITFFVDVSCDIFMDKNSQFIYFTDNPKKLVPVRLMAFLMAAQIAFQSSEKQFRIKFLSRNTSLLGSDVKQKINNAFDNVFSGVSQKCLSMIRRDDLRGLMQSDPLKLESCLYYYINMENKEYKIIPLDPHFVSGVDPLKKLIVPMFQSITASDEKQLFESFMSHSLFVPILDDFYKKNRVKKKIQMSDDSEEHFIQNKAIFVCNTNSLRVAS